MTNLTSSESYCNNEALFVVLSEEMIIYGRPIIAKNKKIPKFCIASLRCKVHTAASAKKSLYEQN